MFPPLPYCRLLAVTAAALVASTADALVLDWNAVTWNPTVGPANTLTNTFDIDANPGTDVTMTLVYATQNAGSPWRAGLPAIDATLEGGQAAGASSLHLGVDFAAQAHTITITIDFSNYAQGVEGISFSLFDIDRASGSAAYIDQIRSIYAIGLDGTTHIAPTITGIGSTVLHGGTGLNQTLTGNSPAADTGAGSNAGNATISFASPIRSFTFVWGVPNSNANNPIAMDLALGNIGFSPVPEANPAWAGGTACLLVTAWTWRRSRRSKSPTA